MTQLKEMFQVAFSTPGGNKNTDAIKKQRMQKSAQDWMPVIDIDKGIVYLKNNMLLGMIRIYPVNISLLSKSEQKRKVEMLAAELNGINDDFEIFCIGRPVDLSSYLDWLTDRSKTETHIVKKRLLRNMTLDATKKSTSGEIQERRFYLCIYRKNTNENSVNEFSEMLRIMRDKISSADVITDLCDDNELINVCSMFSNPVYAGVDTISIFDMYELPTYITD